jgi:hypothetical protein
MLADGGQFGRPDAGSGGQFQGILDRGQGAYSFHKLSDFLEPELIQFGAAIIAAEAVEPLVVFPGAGAIVGNLILKDVVHEKCTRRKVMI